MALLCSLLLDKEEQIIVINVTHIH